MPTDPDRVKQLEAVVSALRSAFDYYSGLIRQAEDKSRNNVALGVGIVGIGALVAKTDDLVKRIAVAKGVDWLWIGIAALALLASIGMLLYVHALHMGVIEARDFEAPDPEKFAEKADPSKTLEETLRELVSSYKEAGKSIAGVVSSKTGPLNEQPQWIAAILVAIAIYQVFAGIAVALIPIPK